MGSDYIYAGEDLPEDSQSDMPEAEKVDPDQKVEKPHIDFMRQAMKKTETEESSFLAYMELDKLDDMTLLDFTNKAKPALDKKQKAIKKAKA